MLHAYFNFHGAPVGWSYSLSTVQTGSGCSDNKINTVPVAVLVLQHALQLNKCQVRVSTRYVCGYKKGTKTYSVTDTKQRQCHPAAERQSAAAVTFLSCRWRRSAGGELV